MSSFEWENEGDDFDLDQDQYVPLDKAADETPPIVVKAKSNTKWINLVIVLVGVALVGLGVVRYAEAQSTLKGLEYTAAVTGSTRLTLLDEAEERVAKIKKQENIDMKELRVAEAWVNHHEVCYKVFGAWLTISDPDTNMYEHLCLEDKNFLVDYKEYGTFHAYQNANK